MVSYSRFLSVGKRKTLLGQNEKNAAFSLEKIEKVVSFDNVEDAINYLNS